MAGKIQLQENILVVTCRLTPTIRNKFLNYKKTVQSIIVDDEFHFFSFAGTHDCERSKFCNEHHGLKADNFEVFQVRVQIIGSQILSLIVNVRLL